MIINKNCIKKDPERVWNIKPFRNKYNGKEINYQSKIDDWKRFGKYNSTIALNVLHLKEKYVLFIFQKLNPIMKSK